MWLSRVNIGLDYENSKNIFDGYKFGKSVLCLWEYVDRVKFLLHLQFILVKIFYSQRIIFLLKITMV